MRYGEVEVAYLTATCKVETEKALLCVLDTGHELWVPKSLVQHVRRKECSEND